MTVGQRIRKRRLALNMSVDELAKRLDKNRATIYRYEKGEIENLPIDVLEPLAHALATTPQYLMGWENELKVSAIDVANLLARFMGKSVYEPLDEPTIKRFEEWFKTFNSVTFTEEEHKKIMEYGKFLIAQRGK